MPCKVFSGWDNIKTRTTVPILSDLAHPTSKQTATFLILAFFTTPFHHGRVV